MNKNPQNIKPNQSETTPSPKHKNSLNKFIYYDREKIIMKKPKIKLKIDAKQDVKNYVLFRKYSLLKFLKMFLPLELHFILDKNLSEEIALNVVQKYIKEKFKTNRNKIKKNVTKTQKKWENVEEEFFHLTNYIFKEHSWPKGEYIGFASMFDMYPKDISKKIFYFPALRINDSIKTISHEMLHFIFFDYIETKFNIKEDDCFKNKNPLYLWNFSETFNLVMETWKPYQKIFKTKGKPYDQAHAKMLPKMKKIWDEKNDIDYLLDYYFKSLDKN